MRQSQWFGIDAQAQNFLLFSVIMLSLLCLFQQLNTYQRLWHNIDLAYNTLKDPYKEQTIMDEYEVGKKMPLRSLYIRSMGDIIDLPMITAITGIVFGLSLGALLVRRTE